MQNIDKSIYSYGPRKIVILFLFAVFLFLKFQFSGSSSTTVSERHIKPGYYKKEVLWRAVIFLKVGYRY